MYKRQGPITGTITLVPQTPDGVVTVYWTMLHMEQTVCYDCLLYTSDAADERSSVDLGGRRIIKKKKKREARNVGDGTQNTVTS